MQFSENDVVMSQAYNSRPPPSEEDDEECLDMEASVRAVEKLLEGYNFKDKKLLEEALTHKSCNDQSANYDRLEYLGDAALGLAISNHMFKAYRQANQDQLTKLRSVNASTEKLARLAVRHGLYRYVRRKNTAPLDKEVEDFTRMVQQEVELELYGGALEAPKVLADIVESVAGAVYVDCELDLETLWRSFKGLLEPIVSLEELQQNPHPVDLLNRLCQRRGEWLNFEPRTEGEGKIVSVCIDGKFIAESHPSKNGEHAKLRAAMAALAKLPYKISDVIEMRIDLKLDGNGEVQDAKPKLKELCEKKKWPHPEYRILERIGPAHDERFICSVEIATGDSMTGDEKSRVIFAENSAASKLLRKLLDL